MGMTVATSAALQRLAASRDPDAWSVIVQLHGEAMLRTALRITRDRHLAEDVCQDALLQIRDDARQFRPRSSNAEADARSWILRIVCNTAMKMMQRRRLAQRQEKARASVDCQPNSESSEMIEIIERELTCLPERLREPIILHFYGGMDYRGVSSAIGCSEAAAKMRASRGLQRLRERLAMLGVILAFSDLIRLVSRPSHPIEVAIPQEAWLEMLHSPRQPEFHITLQGVSRMMKLTLTTTACVLVAFAATLTQSTAADNPAGEPNPATVAAQPPPTPSAPSLDQLLEEPMSVAINADVQHALEGVAGKAGIKLNWRNPEWVKQIPAAWMGGLLKQEYRSVPLKTILDHICSTTNGGLYTSGLKWSVEYGEIVIQAVPLAKKLAPVVHPGIAMFRGIHNDLPLIQGFCALNTASASRALRDRQVVKFSFHPFESWAAQKTHRVGDFVEGAAWRREIVAIDDCYVFVEMSRNGEYHLTEVFTRRDLSIVSQRTQWTTVNSGRHLVNGQQVPYVLQYGEPSKNSMNGGQWSGLRPCPSLKAISKEVPLDGVFLETLSCKPLKNKTKIEGNDFDYVVLRYGRGKAEKAVPPK